MSVASCHCRSFGTNTTAEARSFFPFEADLQHANAQFARPWSSTRASAARHPESNLGVPRDSSQDGHRQPLRALVRHAQVGQHAHPVDVPSVPLGSALGHLRVPVLPAPHVPSLRPGGLIKPGPVPGPGAGLRGGKLPDLAELRGHWLAGSGGRWEISGGELQRDHQYHATPV